MAQGRQGDARGREDAADRADDGSAGDDAVAVFPNRGFLEAVEIAQQVGPFVNKAVAIAQIGQLFLQHQGEERAEHMAANGGIEGMINFQHATQPPNHPKHLGSVSSASMCRRTIARSLLYQSLRDPQLYPITVGLISLGRSVWGQPR